MRAIVIEQYGGPEVLRLRGDVSRPIAGPGEVLVRVAYAGINFMDILTRQGRYENSRTYPVRLPCTLGMEGAGDVVEVGQGVHHLFIGDRVAWCTAWGSYAEYASIPAALAARLPNSISYDLAAASMFQGCTAHYLIREVAKLQDGSTCLIHAASGSIGQLLVQMAKRQGATVFTTASTSEKRAVAMGCGADHSMPYDNGGFADAVRVATRGRGVDVVFDAVGKTTLRDSFRATRTRGLVVNLWRRLGDASRSRTIRTRRSGVALPDASAACRSHGRRGNGAATGRRCLRRTARGRAPRRGCRALHAGQRARWPGPNRGATADWQGRGVDRPCAPIAGALARGHLIYDQIEAEEHR